MLLVGMSEKTSAAARDGHEGDYLKTVAIAQPF